MFLLFFHGFPMLGGRAQCFPMFSTVFYGEIYFSMVFLWFSYGLPWFSYGFSYVLGAPPCIFLPTKLDQWADLSARDLRT